MKFIIRIALQNLPIMRDTIAAIITGLLFALPLFFDFLLRG